MVTVRIGTLATYIIGVQSGHTYLTTYSRGIAKIMTDDHREQEQTGKTAGQKQKTERRGPVREDVTLD